MDIPMRSKLIGSLRLSFPPRLMTVSAAALFALAIPFGLADRASAQVAPAPAVSAAPGGSSETGQVPSAAEVQGPAAKQPAGSETLKLPEYYVTGSYIPRSSTFQETGSPVTVTTAIDMDQVTAVVTDVSDYTRYIPSNPESSGQGWASSYGTNNGGAPMNLRGLGPGATLTLINGHRQVGYDGIAEYDGSVDVDSLAPEIAIARVEVLMDGASSLYGSDAVAGVANFITRDDFSGVEIKSNWYGATQYHENTYNEGVIIGNDPNEKVHTVFSFQYNKQQPIRMGQTGIEQQYISSSTSGYGFPGNFTVPTRNPAGVISGSTPLADPSCATVIADDITTNPAGIPEDSIMINGRCRLEFNMYEFMNDQEKMAGRFFVEDKLAPWITFKGDISVKYIEVWQWNYASGPLSFTLNIPGTNPGNTFQAMNASGQPLYAVPNPANPSQPLLNSAGTAVLTATPTNPASGIPFNENVVAGLYRPFSTADTLGQQNPNTELTIRGDAGFEGRIGSNWSWKVNYGYSAQTMIVPSEDVNEQNLINAVNCNLTVGLQHNLCFNPFGNALLVGPSSPMYNSPAVIAAIEAPLTTKSYATLTSLDAVVTGEPVNLWAGPLGIAVGDEMYRESAQMTYDPLEISGQTGIAPPVYNFDGSDIHNAIFAELRLPVLKGPAGRAEISASGRYESDQYTSAFNPKFSGTYSYGWFTLLASWGTSFVAPSIFQRIGDYGQGLLPVTDPTTGQVVQPPVFTTGSTKLQPEKSTAYSAGIKLSPGKDFSFGATFWSTDFKNLLTTLASQAEINANPYGPDIIRNPTNNQVTEILIPYINAGSLNADGFDLDARYRFSAGGIGFFTPFATASEWSRYNAVVTPGAPVIGGIGTDNSNNFGYPIPKWRFNTGIEWALHEQSATALMHYIDRCYDATAMPQSEHPQVRLDLQYSYDFRKIVSGLYITVGVTNSLGAIPSIVAAKTYDLWIASVADVFPRRWFVTMDYKF